MISSVNQASSFLSAGKVARKILVLFFLPLMLFTGSMQAGSLYLNRMQAAHWDARQLEETIELLEKHKPIKPAAPLKLSPFHHQANVALEQQRDFCVSCHTSLPHRENERLRSYLNMHVNTLACTSCHFRPEGVDLEYRRLVWREGETPETSLSLIVPYSQEGIEAFTNEQPEIARQLQAWENADMQHKGALHLRIHSPLEKEGFGCQACHTREHPLLDLKSLGYDEEAIRKIHRDLIARYLGDESRKDEPIKLIDLMQ